MKLPIYDAKKKRAGFETAESREQLGVEGWPGQLCKAGGRGNGRSRTGEKSENGNVANTQVQNEHMSEIY